MMDFSQVVYDRLSGETLENDGEVLFEKNSSHGRSFIATKVQAVSEFADLTTSEFVSQYTG